MSLRLVSRLCEFLVFQSTHLLVLCATLPHTYLPPGTVSYSPSIELTSMRCELLALQSTSRDYELLALLSTSWYWKFLTLQSTYFQGLWVIAGTHLQYLSGTLVQYLAPLHQSCRGGLFFWFIRDPGRGFCWHQRKGGILLQSFSLSSHI